MSSILRWLMPKESSNNVRKFTTSPFRLDDGQRLRGDTYKVNNFEKRMLVWMKKYKAVDQVPKYIAPEVMERVRSKVRIRVANYMMGLTLVGCVAMVISGKRARERGESLQQYNLDWHKKNKEEHEAKEKM